MCAPLTDFLDYADDCSGLKAVTPQLRVGAPVDSWTAEDDKCRCKSTPRAEFVIRISLGRRSLGGNTLQAQLAGVIARNRAEPRLHSNPLHGQCSEACPL